MTSLNSFSSQGRSVRKTQTQSRGCNLTTATCVFGLRILWLVGAVLTFAHTPKDTEKHTGHAVGMKRAN